MVHLALPGYNRSTMRAFGKLLQMAGLVILPAAMMMQFTAGLRADTGGGFTVSAMLLMTLMGVGLFMAGRILEGHSRPL
jgi:nitric oxide reductase large subunit